ncbi:hypothetical protein QYE76_007304 [Lolium multiflorum]|uniref:CCHC-type domain-containing protein n=1 Tax=Lolium multiflorum TaxID=4521 RepID=A0AAD8W461_LOLMU|nr:hypothetical protein QYE76_007304 [Lolium multiflorum]
MRYGCSTPSPETGRDLAESSTALARRALKRLQRLQAQRLAATAAIEFDEGFTWKRLEVGAPAALRRLLPSKMNGDDGQNFNPGRGTFNHGRGGFQPRGGYGGAGRGAYAARGRQGMRGRGGQGAGPGHGFGGGRAGQTAGMNSFGRNNGRGDAGGAAGMTGGQGFHDDNWGAGPSNYQRGPRFGYGANQRWNNNNNAGRGGYQNRFGATSHGGVTRGGIDADLLQQTVHAVVAAVTAAQKVPEVAGTPQAHTTPSSEAGVAGRAVLVSATGPTVGQQQGVVAQQQGVVAQQMGVDPQIAVAKGKEDEGPGPSKKKKEEKMGCFRCKQPGHYIDDCPTPFCDLCTLFGKTLDVDMAFTRKNKVLRIKIGCLDSRLIPADSDMFIRRGFFKLKFEVESAQGNQEENMAEANNGNDGNGDAKDGEGNNGDDNAMDMDPKKNEAGDTSSNKMNVESSGTNVGDGMQEQIELFEAIQIGSMSLKISPSDYVHGGCVSGLSPGRPRDSRSGAAVQGSKSAPVHLSEQVEQCRGSQSGRATSRSPAGVVSACTAMRDQRSPSQSAPAAWTNAAGERAASGRPHLTPGVMVGHTRVDAGSSAPAEVVPIPSGSLLSPQRIRQEDSEGPGMHAQVPDTHELMIAKDLQSLQIPGGFSVAAAAVAIGVPKISNEGRMDIAVMNVTNEQGVGIQESMGIASSPKPNEEVIAFGGIPKPSAGLRSSTRLGGQSNADMPILEKAMKNVQLDDSINPVRRHSLFGGEETAPVCTWATERSMLLAGTSLSTPVVVECSRKGQE